MIREMLEEKQEQLMKELKVECKKEFIVNLDTNKLNLERLTNFDKNGNKIHDFSEDTKKTYYYNNDNMLIAIAYSKDDKKSIGCYCYNNDNNLEYVYIDGKRSVTYDITNKIGYYMDETFSFVEKVDIYNNDWLIKKEIKRYEDSGQDIITYKDYDVNKNLISTRNHLFTIEYGYDELDRITYKKVREIDSEEEIVNVSIQYDNNMIVVHEIIDDGDESITKVEFKLDDRGLFSEILLYNNNRLKEKTVYSYEFYN